MAAASLTVTSKGQLTLRKELLPSGRLELHAEHSTAEICGFIVLLAGTNVLVRALVQDDPEQARAAGELLEQAELVAVPLPVLCELVWVLRRVYPFSSAEYSNAIRALISARSVVVDPPAGAVELGLSLLDVGGDFADGIIAMAGSALGAIKW